MPAKALPLANITASIAAVIVPRLFMDDLLPKLYETSVNAMIEAKRMSIENVFAHGRPVLGVKRGNFESGGGPGRVVERNECVKLARATQTK
jgi:hypothetical protein